MLHPALALLLSFAPAGVHQVFPAGATDSQDLAFLQIFLLTAPWTIAVAMIAAAEHADKLSATPSSLLYVTGVLVGSSLLGESVAPGVPDLTTFMQDTGFGTHGPIVFLFGLCFWTVFNYSMLYGFALWMAGLAVGTYFGWLIAEKTSILGSSAQVSRAE